MTLSHEQARRFYDRFGARQDDQASYEDPATELLVREGHFKRASAVLEFGAGTGRLASRLLTGVLPPTCTYLAIDQSATMVRLARERLQPWGVRAEVRHSGGEIAFDCEAAVFDRVLSTYVLDLLSEEDIGAFVAEAHRALRVGGLLCLASLTHGRGPATSVVSSLWKLVYGLRPALVGGCRPVEIADYLAAANWEVRSADTIASRLITSQLLVAERLR